MSKHTPGPWKMRESKSGDFYMDAWNYYSEDGAFCDWKGLAKVYVSSGDEGTECEGKANARLIAAAPELRESIEAALKEWDILPRDRAFTLAEVTDWLTRYMAPAMDAMRAAIAKAEGQP